MSLGYFSVKHNHSSTKRTALEMTYCRNNLPVCIYFWFIVFLVMTLPTFSHKCQNNVQCFVISDYFHKIPNQFLIENIDMTGQKDYKMLPRKYSLFLG